MQISLSDKISVYGREVHNRVLFQPMEGCDGTADGAVDELTRRRYLRFAEGSPGIIWFEATAVCNEGRANPRQLYINENTLDSFKDTVSQIKAKSKEPERFSKTSVASPNTNRTRSESPLFSTFSFACASTVSSRSMVVTKLSSPALSSKNMAL